MEEGSCFKKPVLRSPERPRGVASSPPGAAVPWGPALGAQEGAGCSGQGGQQVWVPVGNSLATLASPRRGDHPGLCGTWATWTPCPSRRQLVPTPIFLGFPCGSTGKEFACNLGDLGSIPGLGRSLGEKGKDNSLQVSCLGNPRDRGAWRATVYGVAKSQTPPRH